MISDPNWLYSTIAQSSAAIVAIVGGFITASVLMLRAERRSLAHQQADKRTRLEALKSEEVKLVDSIETMLVEMFFKMVASELTAEDELPSLQELLQRHPGWDLHPEILKREYSKMCKRTLEAREFIYHHSDKIDVTQDVAFNEWLMTNKLDISEYDYDILESEYDRIRERQRTVLAEERRTAGWPLIAPDVTFPKVVPIMSLWEQRELGSRKDRLSNVRHEKFMLEHEVSDLHGRLTSFRDPQDLRWGLCVLAYLAGVGILFPVIVIAKEVYFTITKQFAIGLFFSGLIAIFGYIVFQINRLRR